MMAQIQPTILVKNGRFPDVTSYEIGVISGSDTHRYAELQIQDVRTGEISLYFFDEDGLSALQTLLSKSYARPMIDDPQHPDFDIEELRR